MGYLHDILNHNRAFVEKQKEDGMPPTVSKRPDKKVAILTCMDTRLVGLLEQALGHERGSCNIIKNAGAIVAHPFGGVMRSLIVAIYELNVTEIVVIGHKDCGMANIEPEKIEQKILERGVSPDILRGIEATGMDLHHWLGGFKNEHESVRKTTEEIRMHPLVPDEYPVHGLVIDPETGKLDLVVDGYDVQNLKNYEQFRKENQGQSRFSRRP